MKTVLRRFTAGIAMTILGSTMNACSPVLMEPTSPRRVVHVVNSQPPAPVYAAVNPPPPVSTVVVQPVIPVWAPPYTYVTEVHYYYFPDYMVYYDIFGRNYVYYDGFSWVNVAMLPSLPVFVGFSPYNSYIVVLDRHCDRPWYRHHYYEEHYPRGYYNTYYAPRQSLSSNTVLRAYDENQSRPLFVDRHSNKEVAVKYDVVPSPRGSVSNPVRNNSINSVPRSNGAVQNPRSEINNTQPVRSNPAQVMPRNNVIQNPEVNTIPRGQVKENSVTVNPRINHAEQSSDNNTLPRVQVRNNSIPDPPVRNNNSKSIVRNDQHIGRSETVNQNNYSPVRNPRQTIAQPEVKSNKQKISSMPRQRDEKVINNNASINAASEKRNGRTEEEKRQSDGRQRIK